MTVQDGMVNVKVDQIALANAAIPFPYRLGFLITDDAPPEFLAFYHSLAQNGTAIQSIPLSDHTLDTLVNAEFEAICGFAHHACWRAFERVYHSDRADRPLCVLLGEPDAEGDAETYPLDVIAPLSASALRVQLRTALQMRRQIIELETRNRALQERITAQEQQIAAYDRSHNELLLLKSAMVRNVSHELRTPLLQLKCAVSMLHEDAPESTLTQLAMLATGRLEATVQNITQLASSMEISLAPVVIREVIQAAVRALGRTLMHKHHIDRVDLKLPDKLPPVLGDKQGLITVIVQLLDNALKFSKERVTVNATPEHNCVAVCIRDAGIGIAENELSRIFDSFYQVDSSGTRRYGGSGVGLAIVKLILDKHGAPIDVETREGQGSAFTFRLKLANLYSDKDSLAE